jgi:pectate lyase
MLGTTAAAQPVIPGAVGFGIDTPAGRGGKIIRVTNLNASGEGSLRACVNASGPRICVFEVSGTIRLDSNVTVSDPYLTIAGQTAPAPGIMLRGAALRILASDVLVQHIAVRAGDDEDGPMFQARDALKINATELVRNIVIDHCSFSWGIDENVEVSNSWDNVTISNSIISEPLRDSLHPKGAHGLGVLITSNQDNSRIAMIGNLMAHAHGRNPRSNAAEFVLVNNVVYNARGDEAMLFNYYGMTSDNTVVGNAFIKGRDASDAVKPVRLVGETQWGDEILPGTKLYVADNSASSATADPWSIVDNQSLIARVSVEASNILSWPTGLEALPSSDVVNHVLANAGTRPAQRNEVDANVVADVKNGTGRIINCVSDDGSARCSKNAGGWPSLARNTRRLTLPDDPHQDDDGDGYTNVEEWLHAMAAEVEGRSGSEDPEPPDTPEPSSSPPKPPRLQD